MTNADWIMIAAIFLGPLFAVRITRFLDDQKEIRERKVNIFKTLMATRAYIVSWAHVEALNRIDLEFDKNHKKERDVIEAWKEYLDLLNNTGIPMEQWDVKRIDLLVELLHKMARVLKYDFDKTHIKNSSYSPRAHTDTEDEQAALRKGLLDIINGQRVLPMSITNWPDSSSKDES